MIRKAVIAAALLMAGCAQVPMADSQADQTAKGRAGFKLPGVMVPTVG